MNKVLIALLAGFAAGILLAPDKGSVTRKKITDRFNDLSDKLSDFAEKITSEGGSISSPKATVPKMSEAI
jgi:gas vesicle protein